VREDRHRILNDVLLAAFAEDFSTPVHKKNGGD
jgi:hypothetical protein